MLYFLYRDVRARLVIGWLLWLLSGAALAQAPAPAAAAPPSADAVPATAAEPAPEPERVVLVLGDSISAAYGMSLEQGWVTLLREALSASHPDVRVINASISGETTAGGLRRLPNLLSRYQPAVLLVELGGNDGLRGFPLSELRYNLEQMVYLARREEATVILLPMKIPPNYGSRYTRVFNGSFKRVAELTGATLAPFILEGIAGNPELMQEDGIHPRAEAQEKLLENVLPTVLRALDAP